jgi:sulfate/thiosulfate transport system substrate-binding protein
MPSPERHDRHCRRPLVTIDDTFGGWEKAQSTHFNDGGTFDRIYGQ